MNRNTAQIFRPEPEAPGVTEAAGSKAWSCPCRSTWGELALPPACCPFRSGVRPLGGSQGKRSHAPPACLRCLAPARSGSWVICPRRGPRVTTPGPSLQWECGQWNVTLSKGEPQPPRGAGWRVGSKGEGTISRVWARATSRKGAVTGGTGDQRGTGVGRASGRCIFGHAEVASDTEAAPGGH